MATRDHRIHIIGIDPGKHVGMAHYYEDVHGTIFRSLVTETNQVRMVLDDWTEECGLPIVVCERFFIGGNTVKKTRQTDALEVIGNVESYCGERELIFDLQAAGDAKRMGNRPVLELLRWWRGGHEMDHANDAAAHVLLGLARHHPAVINSLIA